MGGRKASLREGLKLLATGQKGLKRTQDPLGLKPKRTQEAPVKLSLQGEDRALPGHSTSRRK
jgi:hypothetical protein